MKLPHAMSFSRALPLPDFVLHPFTVLVIAAVHVNLGFGHLLKLFGGEIQWIHIWKGFGAQRRPRNGGELRNRSQVCLRLPTGSFASSAKGA